MSSTTQIERPIVASVNPYTGHTIATYPTDSKKSIKSKLAHSRKGASLWKRVSVRQRAAYLSTLAAYILDNKEHMALVAAQEMGKPISQGIAEIEKSARSLEYYAANAGKFMAPEVIETSHSKSYVTLEPLGTILAVMPWNFPYWQVFRAIGPALLAGNAMLLKHASNVTGCALEIEKAMHGTGIPNDVFQILIIPGSEMEPVIADPAVDALTFTGSSEAGSAIAATAARHLKKQVLELGGSDAYIIMNDADAAYAAQTLVRYRFNNCGQSCIAPKRIIAVGDIKEKLEERIVFEVQKLKIGNPEDAHTVIGPMSRADLRDELHRQVTDSIREGARLLLGGKIINDKNALYAPTVLTDVRKGMRAYDEELFGPVATIIGARTTEEAIAIANDSVYGLGGGIFSSDTATAEQIAAEQIQAGAVAVNDCVSSDPRMPFGGIKQSGYGRELSDYAIKEFSNIKSVVVK